MRELTGITQQEIQDIFAASKSIITDDHFVYAEKADGWYHGSAYVNKDAIYPYTRFVSPLCKALADYFWGEDVEVVVGPTVGGVSLSQWVAHHYAPFPHQREVLSVYADEEDIIQKFSLTKSEIFEDIKDGRLEFPSARGVNILFNADNYNAVEHLSVDLKIGTKRVLKRGYDKIVQGKRCLIVEDVINSGTTVKKVAEAVRWAGGEVIGVGALCNRNVSKVTAETLGVKELFSLLETSMNMYPEDECSICWEKGFQSVRTDLGKGKEFLIRKGLAT